MGCSTLCTSCETDLFVGRFLYVQPEGSNELHLRFLQKKIVSLSLLSCLLN